MLTRRFHLVLGLSACLAGAALATVACDLNPQPLPPGETENGFDSGAPATIGGPGGADAGTTGLGSGTSADASSPIGDAAAFTDAVAPIPPPGGDGGPAADADAASDASGDAAPDADASADSGAVTDASEDGG